MTHDEATPAQSAPDEPMAYATVDVASDPATTFQVFTEQIGSWWRSDVGLWAGVAPHGTPRFEPGVGGRLLFEPEDSSGSTRELGSVRVWEPGPRLVFSFRSPDDDQARPTEVEVRFEAVEGGTRVAVQHRGWETTMGADLVRRHETAWASLLARFAERSLERVLLDRLGQFLDAISTGDQAFFADNLTEDALAIFPGGGNVYTKPEIVASMADHPPYLKHAVTDPTVVQLEDSSAVLVHHARIQNERDAEPSDHVVSSVFVRRNDSWKMAMLQWTPAEG